MIHTATTYMARDCDISGTDGVIFVNCLAGIRPCIIIAYAVAFSVVKAALNVPHYSRHKCNSQIFVSEFLPLLMNMLIVFFLWFITNGVRMTNLQRYMFFIFSIAISLAIISGSILLTWNDNDTLNPGT